MTEGGAPTMATTGRRHRPREGGRGGGGGASDRVTSAQTPFEVHALMQNTDDDDPALEFAKEQDVRADR